MEVQGFYAYPYRLRLRRAEPFENVQRLSEQDARRVRPLRIKGRFRDSFEDFRLLVGVADLSGKHERCLVVIERLAVPARPAARSGQPAKRDHLLGQVSDLLGYQPRLLMVGQRLAVPLGLCVHGADIVERLRLIGEIADLAVYGECLPVGSEPFLVIALVIVDTANIVVQNCLVLQAAYLAEYLQRGGVGFERVPVTAAMQLYLAKIVEGLRLAAPVPGLAVERQRFLQVGRGVAEVPKLPGGDP